MADIVDDFLTRLQTYAPDLPMTARVNLERDMRQAHGGTEPYVGKRMSRATRLSLVANGLRQSRPLAEVFACAGVRKSTGYTLLKMRQFGQ